MTTTLIRPLFEARRGAAVPWADARARLLAVTTGSLTDANPWILGPSARVASTYGVDPTSVTVAGGPHHFDVLAGGRGILSVEVDEAACRIAVQGRWWYRGEYSIVETWEGVTVSYKVFNVATQPKWMVSLANNRFKDYEREVHREVARVAERLEDERA